MHDNRRFHTVIVGAGTAGCVLANRLSANPDVTVALVEAGPDFGNALSGEWPEAIVRGELVPTPYDWGYKTSIHGQTLPYIRGKVMGGSSSINASGINWGLRRDYDAWAALGNPGWGFDDLVPFFQKVERMENDDPPYRGRDGMLVVNRIRAHSPFFADLAAAYEAAGIEAVRDVAGPDALQGYGFPTRNVRSNVRFHSAAAYLDPVRACPNLTILALTEIERLHWAKGNVHTLEANCQEEHFAIEAERVVLAGGAMGTPLLLQRSGVGPAARLRRILGPDQPIVDLPGVGRNLRDHFGSQFIVSLAEGASDRLGNTGDANGSAKVTMNLRLKSRPELDAFDLDVLAIHATRRPDRTADETVEFKTFLVHLAAEGYVEITGPDPSARPMIETGIGLDGDFEALALGFEWLRERAQHKALRPWIASELVPGADKSGPALRKALRQNVQRYSHPIGTAKLGPSTDPMAVVGADGKVYGFDNLYVADASVFPTIPRGMINLSVYAAAEKIAALLARG